MKVGDTVVVKQNGLLATISWVYEPTPEDPFYYYNVNYVAVCINHWWYNEFLEAHELVLESVFDSKLYKVLG